MKIVYIVLAINIVATILLLIFSSEKCIQSRTDMEEKILREEEEKQKLGSQENG